MLTPWEMEQHLGICESLFIRRKETQRIITKALHVSLSVELWRGSYWVIVTKDMKTQHTVNLSLMIIGYTKTICHIFLVCSLWGVLLIRCVYSIYSWWSKYNVAGAIKMVILFCRENEDQRVWMQYRGPGFLASFSSIPLLPHPPPPLTESWKPTHRKTEKERQLDDWRGVGGRGGAKSYDREKAWSYKNHSILADVNY